MLDPTRKMHPYLFEHHPEQNVQSFLRTVIGSALPIRFWTNLHPNQPLRAGRLWVFTFLICLPTVFTPTIVLIAPPLVTKLIENQNERKNALATLVPGTKRYDFVTRIWGSVPAYLDQEYPTGVMKNFDIMMKNRRLVSAWAVLTTVMLVPMLTFLLFINFRFTLSRAKLNLQHIHRTIAYNSDVMLWFTLLFASGFVLNKMYSVVSPSDFHEITTNTAYALAFFFALKVSIASVKYLRFKRALMVAVSTQIIVFLIIANAYFITYYGWN